MTSIIDTIQTVFERGTAGRPKIGGFPYLAEALRAASVATYYFDVPSSTVICATNDGEGLLSVWLTPDL